ncbi:hypothetical protein EDD18DRAFT_1159103 [Armillaria luteobubalina]|uniref:Uncharacterized protein n=1 Tax=Armillaria luteobubalina TaxID=153913 RepID=A0AA39Q7L0_9AGAR|nr:hypothetical protein EDD18DRAFT_1159103 [Armillaria luteobubalina]
MTCHVDLTESDKDAAMHPYSVFCSMPNYIGFRKCFPNMKHIHLKIRFRINSYVYTHHGQLTRTRVSIKLDKAPAAPSILPVDWCIAVSDAPDIDEVDEHNICNTWESLLMDITSGMVQRPFWESRSICNWYSYGPAMKDSTCCEDVRHFQNHTYWPEQKGDLRDINYFFSKAVRKHINFNTFLSGIYEDLRWAFSPCIGCERRLWSSYPSIMAVAWPSEEEYNLY